MFKFLGMTFALAVFINPASATPPSAYAGEERREIKAMSPEEVQAYLTGKGAGLAKAAELNHYPGPTHVLDLADALQLSAEQRSRTKEIFEAMQKAAVVSGRQLVEQEHALDRQFANGTITMESLRSALTHIGASQADVRRAHLEAHLALRTVLSKAQIAKYDELRGYGASATPNKGAHTHQH